MNPAVTITKGSSGWGGPLTVSETETRKVVASVTGGSTVSYTHLTLPTIA